LLAAPASAARHQKRRARQLTARKSSEDVLDRAANESNHLDARRSEPCLERRRDGAANENFRTQAGQFGGSVHCVRPDQPHLLPPDFASIFEIDD